MPSSLVAFKSPKHSSSMSKVEGECAYLIAAMWRTARLAESGTSGLKEAGVFGLSNPIDRIHRSGFQLGNRETE